MENLSSTVTSNQLDDQAFIELVKECIGSTAILPIMTLLHEGKNTREKLDSALSHLPAATLHECLDKMIKFAIVQPLNKSSVSAGPAWFLTPVGQEFRLILQDIERLKLKYRE
ncbi:hypothetical protein [Planctobacterium marinum]|uniref:hypothetical protein n=1 Tax=Planctobacterium marinum TaxID=1631968 RepID=UPI001E3B296B|nr:hypothetical protein [Planctobacterium marinum]MCC2607476.1 hypothetical protein [Planctobacterium marinum]